MKIKLENFRCWKKNEFCFSNNCINLLNGPSGRGKSSIMEAINFAISGEGKNIKTYGSKSTKVELEFDTLKITRTKAPNSLLVKIKDKEYHDDIAEKMIHNIFTKYFGSVSYISQNARNSFFKMSPNEKLEFIENFALDITDKKLKIQEIMTERKDTLKEITVSLKTTREIEKNIVKPEDIKFPVKCEEKELEKTIKKYMSLEEKLVTDVENLKQKTKTLEKNIKEHTELTNEIQKIEHSLSEKYEQRDNCETKISKYPYDEETIKTCKQKISEMKKVEEYRKYQSKLEELKQRRDSIQETLDNLMKINVWENSEYTPEELDENISGTESFLSEMKKYFENRKKKETLEKKLKDYENIQEEISNIETEIQKLKQKREGVEKMRYVHKCPHCSTKLFVKDNKLEVYGDVDYSDEINELEKTVKQKIDKKTEELKTKKQQHTESMKYVAKLDTIIKEMKETEDSYETISDDLTEYEENLQYYKKQKSDFHNKDMENKIRVKTNQETLQKIKKEIKELENVVSELDVDTEEEYNVEELHSKLAKEQTNKEMNQKLKRELEEINKIITKYVEKLGEINEKSENCNFDKKEYDDLVEKLEKYKENLEKTVKINEKIRSWVRNEELKEKYENILEKISDLEQDEKDAEKSLQSILSFKEKVLTAEALYLKNFIENFNKSLKTYLDLFFQNENDPITLYLETFKVTTKNTKPQIEIKVFYKGNETDIQSLSGGEQDRVNLAFTLAFSNMYSGQILLLDECISSLDTENYTNVMEVLKEHIRDKTIILVSHQANEGLFDEIINI